MRATALPHVEHRTFRNTPSSEAVSLGTGRVMSGAVVLFLLLDGAIKLVPLPVVGRPCRAWASRRPWRARSAS